MTANPPNYTLVFADDFGRSAICLDTAYGNWQWSVLKGNGTGNVYTGAGTVMSGSGYMRVVAAAGLGLRAEPDLLHDGQPCHGLLLLQARRGELGPL